MQRLVIAFADGELLYAETPDLHFDLPVIEAEITNIDSNGERAILPLVGIRQMIVGEVEAAPPAAVLETWDRAAFHFMDGQVMRARVGPDVLLGAHGGIWPVVEPGSDELRRLAIPYSSLKGVFRLRQWDSRPPNLRDPDPAAPHLEHMVRVLAEREARARGGAEERSSGLLGRLRRNAADDGPPAAPGSGTVSQ